MPPFKDLAGQKFSRLLVLHKDPSITGRTYWKCRCDCGNETLVRADSLHSGAIASCGCFHSEAAREIGMLKRISLDGKTEKKCTRCKNIVPKEGFTERNWLTNGRACINCVSAKGKIYARANASKLKNNRLKSKYGITSVQFEEMLIRQFGRCLGCQRDFNLGKPRAICVDHDHKCCPRDKSCGECVRGLLCQDCNNVLGRADEDKATLRRLISYLGYDRTKWQIYVIGSLRNESIRDISQDLRKEGYDVMDEWHASGPTADDCWQAYEQKRGRTYAEALKGRSAQNVFLFDRSYLDLCDVGILVTPYGKSGGLETGYLRGKGKPVFILQLEDTGRYDVMPNFATAVCNTVDDLKIKLQQTLGSLPEKFINPSVKSKKTFSNI